MTDGANLPTSRKTAKTSRKRSTRRRAARGEKTVRDLRRRLDELDRELDQTLERHDAAPIGWTSVAEAALRSLGDAPALGRLFARLERVSGSERADDFGLDPDFEELIAPIFGFLYRRWWRVDVETITNVPSEGAALLVANHAGAVFPWDGAMLKVALRVDHPAAREVRPLVENFAFDTPFVGSFMTRTGGVRACQENAERLLLGGQVVAVFPEGLRGMAKPFSKRYRLQRFGRGGFVTLCLRTGAPLVPVAIVGSEEIHPLLTTFRWPAKLVGMPYLPVTPTFPWLGPLGLVPLPTKWTMVFGEPIAFGGRYGPDDAADDLLIDRLSAEVRDRIQEMIADALRRRRSVFF